MDRIKEYCGLFGVYGEDRAVMSTFLGLYSLQHRGEESCGIVSFDGRKFHQNKGLGLVAEVLDQDKIDKQKGFQAIGHVRYSTTGSSAIKNIQPLFVDSRFGSFCLAHNGNLTNSLELKDYLERRGAIFQTTSDSELILHLMTHSKKAKFVDKLKDALSRIRGAYCLLLMNEEGIFAVRDPLGFRPLCIGRKNGSFFISSETSVFGLSGV